MGQILWRNLWNSLKDNIRLSQDLSSFKNIIFKIDFACMRSSLYLYYVQFYYYF